MNSECHIEDTTTRLSGSIIAPDMRERYAILQNLRWCPSPRFFLTPLESNPSSNIINDRTVRVFYPDIPLRVIYTPTSQAAPFLMTVHLQPPLLAVRPLSGSSTCSEEVDFRQAGFSTHPRATEPTLSRRLAWCRHQHTLKVINSGRNTHKTLTLRPMLQQLRRPHEPGMPFKPKNSRSSVPYVIRRRARSKYHPTILSTDTPLVVPCRASPISKSSSGHSSPQSSLSPVIFSSNSSTSSRSPVSSEKSSAELSPQPSHSVRRQPRIQVSSLLADSHTR